MADRKPTKNDVEKAIAVLVAAEPITSARDLLAAAGCTGLVIGGQTPYGSSFLLTQPTTPQMRGMLREVIARHAAEQRGGRHDA